MRLALYQPDIPQNTGTILRMAACLGVPVDIIGPTGFDISDKALRRSGMDYLGAVDLSRHVGWEDFIADFKAPARQAAAAQNPNQAGDQHRQPTDRQQAIASPCRLVLLTTGASVSYLDFNFTPSDTLLLGRESAGVPQIVHDTADARLAIPLLPGMRSLNIAVAAAIGLSEALRQTQGFSGA